MGPAPANGNFHWCALAVPLEVLHYLAVHEVAPLQHCDHSCRFWHVAETELWERHAEWLKERSRRTTL